MIMEKKSTRVLLTSLVCVVCVALIAVVIAIFYYFIYSPPMPEDNTDTYGIEEINAEEYFQEKSTVVSVTPINDSKDIHNEKDATENFSGRGFDNLSIITNYDMDGEYYDDVEISTDSSKKHPFYKTIYISSTNEIWVIMEINGFVFANPISYNEQSQGKAPVLISETETIISYANQSGVFYETIPNDDEVTVITVDHIDAETLEKLTVEEIDKL